MAVIERDHGRVGARQTDVRQIGVNAPSAAQLLAGYHASFAVLASVPTFFCTRWRGERWLRWIPAIWIRPGCRYFLTYHVDCRLAQLSRELSARLALDPDDQPAASDLERITRYRASLPNLHYRRVLILLLLVAAGVAALLATVIDPGLGMAQTVWNFQSDLLSLNFSHAVTVASEHVTRSLIAFLLIASVFSIVAIVPMTGFRLKRAMFSLYPHAAAEVRRAETHNLRGTYRGIYVVERELFGKLGLAPPRETPFDLALDTIRILVLLPVWLALVFAAAHGLTPQLGSSAFLFEWLVAVPWIVGALFAGIAPWLLFRMWALYRERNGWIPAGGRLRALASAYRDDIASRPRRMVADCIDIALALVCAVFVGVAMRPMHLDDTTLGILIVLILVPLSGLANVAACWRRGRGATLGKVLMRVKVVTADEAPPSLGALAARECFKWFVEVGASLLLLVPLIPVLLVPLLDDQDRAIHDRIGGTVVIARLGGRRLPRYAPHRASVVVG